MLASWAAIWQGLGFDISGNIEYHNDRKVIRLIARRTFNSLAKEE